MSSGPITAELVEYARDLFAPEDAALQALTQAARDAGMPVSAQVSSDVGRFFQMLLRAVGARRVLEIGTFAGYSALWLARALPPDGRVISLEFNPEYAAFAREHLAKMDAGTKVEVRVGAAIELLPSLEREVRENDTPFDAVFLDADKENYPAYFDAATRLLRPGGLLLADNVLYSPSWQTGLLDPAAEDPRVLAVREFNRRLATDPRFTAIIVPMREGVAAAVYQP